MTCELINGLDGIEKLLYLELGVYDNTNYDLINCKKKYSVDMNGKAKFTGTTDEYFASIKPKTRFDIIFIDANHDYEYVLRDFNNSVTICNKWVILHDMIPTDRAHTASNRCSDSFKLLHYIKKNTSLNVYSLDTNYGLTFVKMPGVKLDPPKEQADLTYDQFTDFIKEIKLYTDSEMVSIIRGEYV